MAARVFFVLLTLFAVNVFPQKAPKKTAAPETNKSQQVEDELLKHVAAAEVFQRAGDRANATIENHAVLGIALQRAGNVAIEEGEYDRAVKHLTESLNYADTAANRTNLAIAYLRRNQLDKAAAEAERAVAIDPNFTGANYILGNIYFTQENYAAAKPELEKALKTAPEIAIARALAVTYLQLKEIDNAKKLYDEIQKSVGKESADLHIIFAKDYQKTNYPDEAERELKRALAIEPKKVGASFYLGYLILQNSGIERMPEAGVEFRKELLLNPRDFYSNFFAGVVESSQNRHPEAIKFFTRAVELNPKSSEAYLFLAQSQIELNDLKEAEANLRRSIDLESQDDRKNTQARRTHFMLGRLLLRTDRKEEGEKELAVASRLQQESLQASRNEIDRILGQVAGEKDKGSEDAIVLDQGKVSLTQERKTELSKIKVFLSDVLAQSYHNLAVLEVQNGNVDQAITYFESASGWKADFPGLDRNWGIVSFRARQFDKGIGPLARQLKAKPDDGLIRQMLGTSYYLTNNFSNAVETLKPLEASISNDPELAYFYGISLIQLKRDRDAVGVFERLANSSSNDSSNLFYAAQGFMITGDYIRAVSEFNKIIALNPRQQKANYFLGQSLIRLNRYDDAEKAFLREIELVPGDALANYHLALTLIERKIDRERTIKTLERAIKLKPDYADAYYQLGKIYLENGDVEKAISQLEKAVSYDTSKDYTHYQLSIAYRKASRIEDADRELKLYQELKKANRKDDSPM